METPSFDNWKRTKEKEENTQQIGWEDGPACNNLLDGICYFIRTKGSSTSDLKIKKEL